MAPITSQTLTDELGLETTKVDPSLYFSFRLGELVGINGTYVEDLLRAGDVEFRRKCQVTHEKYEISGDESVPLVFAGFTLSRNSDGSFSIDQNQYRKQLEYLDKSSTFSEFRSMRMKLGWLANTRPDLQFEISQLGQITRDRFRNNARVCVKRLNAAVRYVIDNAASFKVRKLKRGGLRIVGFSDVSYASNHDLTSQLGRMIVLMDKANNEIPISFKSYKSRRVTRSVLSAEVIAFADLLDDALAIRSQLEHALQVTVPMHLLTDSKSLFDVVSKGSRTSEKRIILDIHATKQAYQSHEISNIGFVWSENNLSDGLTKEKKKCALFDSMVTGKHEPVCEQWVIRPETPRFETHDVTKTQQSPS